MTQEKDINVETFILDSLKGIDYGSVEIIIHDSRIVQVEKSIKRRFDK
jgi:hypothetical protein